MKLWHVFSSIDGDVVFDWKTVHREAEIRGVTPKKAARLLAEENNDPLTDERLIPFEVV